MSHLTKQGAVHLRLVTGLVVVTALAGVVFAAMPTTHKRLAADITSVYGMPDSSTSNQDDITPGQVVKVTISGLSSNTEYQISIGSSLTGWSTSGTGSDNGTSYSNAGHFESNGVFTFNTGSTGTHPQNSTSPTIYIKSERMNAAAFNPSFTIKPTSGSQEDAYSNATISVKLTCTDPIDTDAGSVLVTFTLEGAANKSMPGYTITDGDLSNQIWDDVNNPMPATVSVTGSSPVTFQARAVQHSAGTPLVSVKDGATTVSSVNPNIQDQ